MPQLQSVQALRAIAALLVLVHNSILFVAAVSVAPYAETIAWYSYFGTGGVHIFFIISGFIMAYTTVSQPRSPVSSIRFLWRRVIRVYPTYWICLCLYVVAGFALNSTAPDTESIVSTLLLVPGYAGSILIPGWTLAYEMLFYCAFGVCMTLPYRASILSLTALALGLATLGFFTTFGETGPIAAHLSSPLLLEFIVGIWLAQAFLSGRITRLIGGQRLAILLLIAASFGLLVSPFLHALGLPEVVVKGIPSIGIVAAVLALDAFGNSRWARYLIGLGDRSYSLYLVHMVPLTFLAPLIAFDGTMGLFLTTLFMVLISIALAWVIHEVAEKPLLVFLKRLPISIGVRN